MSSMNYDQFKYEFLMNEQIDDGTEEFASIMNQFICENPLHYQRLMDELQDVNMD